MKRISYHIGVLSILFVACSPMNESLREEVASADVVVTEEVMLNDAQEPNAFVSNQGSRSGEDNVLQNSASTKKIIKTGDISIGSKNLKEAKKNIDELLLKFQGYYEQENTTSGHNYTSYNLTIRIPSQSFDSFINRLESGEDKITQKSIRAEDITLRYHDVESRLKSKRGYLDRYQRMVSSAKNVKELLEIEEQIRKLQEDIESQETVLRSMKDQLSYSTLSINLFEYSANLPQGTNSFWSQIMDAFSFSWSLIKQIFLSVIRVWPIIILIIVGAVWWQRRKKQRRIVK